MGDQFITRDEYEARQAELRQDIHNLKSGIDQINNKLDTAKEARLTTLKDILLSFIAGGGLTLFIEVLRGHL